MRNMNRPARLITSIGAGTAVALSGMAPPTTYTAPETSLVPVTPSRPANGWNYEVAPGEIELACPSEPDTSAGLSRGPGESHIAFTALDEHGVSEVIGRLGTRLIVLEPDASSEEGLKTNWQFQPGLPRVHTYGIRDIPNLLTGSGIYEFSVGPSGPSPAEPTAEIYCTNRQTTWPPEYTEERLAFTPLVPEWQ